MKYRGSGDVRYIRAPRRYNYGYAAFINPMLTTIAILLIILWVLGLVTSYTIGGFIHVLLVIAIIMVLIRIIRGQNPVQ